MPNPSATPRPARSPRVVQRWGNSLAVRIPSAVARAARLAEGQAVTVTAEAGGVRVTAQRGTVSLRERLARFDPKRHGGELMATAPVGAERP